MEKRAPTAVTMAHSSKKTLGFSKVPSTIARDLRNVLCSNCLQGGGNQFRFILAPPVKPLFCTVVAGLRRTRTLIRLAVMYMSELVSSRRVDKNYGSFIFISQNRQMEVEVFGWFPFAIDM